MGAMDSAYENASNTINEKVNELGNACNNAAMAIEQVASQTSNNGAYTEQVEALTKNLSALNSVYEMELQETNSRLKQAGELHGSFDQTMTALSESMEDAQKYREEVGKLAKNLTSLNAVYGNMLSAMNAPVNS
jgi:gliding motility-associated protein GldL